MRVLEATSMQTRNGHEMSVDAERAKYRLLQFVSDAGVDVFLQTPVVEVIKDGARVCGVVISTQEGLKELDADVVIDATGDGFVAARAGAEYKIGRDSDGCCQPTSLEFVVDGVDESTAITCWGGTDPVQMPDGQKYSTFCKEANARGELPANVSIVRLHRTNVPGERSVNATQANGFDTLTPEGVFGAEIDLRAQIGAVVAFLRKNVPGYVACRLKASGSSLGVRETRRIMGDRMIQDSDVENGTKQDDVVVHNAWFLIDIHNPTGGGQAEGHSHPAIPFDIPYGALLPRKLDDLLTCGRCISGTHRAHAAYRVMAICMATGQAAGSINQTTKKKGSIIMKKTYKIDVDCANCANKMEQAAKNTDGVKDATVNFMMLKMIVEFEEGADPKKVMKDVQKNCKVVEDDCEIFL